MGKVEEFLKRAADFDALAAEAGSPELRDTYASLAKSYRKLATFMKIKPEESK